MKFEWKLINHAASGKAAGMDLSSHLAKVKGGWIIKNLTLVFSNSGSFPSESSVFIADPNHEWVID